MLTFHFMGVKMATWQSTDTGSVLKSSAIPALADDMLSGVAAISDFTGWPSRRVYYYASTGEVRSLFRIGRQICARRSTLLREIAEREQAVRP